MQTKLYNMKIKSKVSKSALELAMEFRKKSWFSDCDPEKLYLPVDKSIDAPNVESEEKNPNSLLKQVRKLIHLKKTEPALAANAEFVPVYAKENTYPFIFARAAGDDIILAVFNPATRQETANFSLNISAKEFKLLVGAEPQITVTGKDYKLNIGSQSYSLLKVMK